MSPRRIVYFFCIFIVILFAKYVYCGKTVNNELEKPNHRQLESVREFVWDKSIENDAKGKSLSNQKENAFSLLKRHVRQASSNYTTFSSSPYYNQHAPNIRSPHYGHLNNPPPPFVTPQQQNYRPDFNARNNPNYYTPSWQNGNNEYNSQPNYYTTARNPMNVPVSSRPPYGVTNQNTGYPNPYYSNNSTFASSSNSRNYGSSYPTNNYPIFKGTNNTTAPNVYRPNFGTNTNISHNTISKPQTNISPYPNQNVYDQRNYNPNYPSYTTSKYNPWTQNRNKTVQGGINPYSGYPNQYPQYNQPGNSNSKFNILPNQYNSSLFAHGANQAYMGQGNVNNGYPYPNQGRTFNGYSPGGQNYNHSSTYLPQGGSQPQYSGQGAHPNYNPLKDLILNGNSPSYANTNNANTSGHQGNVYPSYPSSQYDNRNNFNNERQSSNYPQGPTVPTYPGVDPNKLYYYPKTNQSSLYDPKRIPPSNFSY